jgi:uncharacterized protein (TIGR03083 family)
VDHAEYLTALRRDVPALGKAARAAEPSAQVAACPGWDARDLAWHVGEVHGFWARIVEGRLAAPPEPWPPPRASSDDDVFAFTDESGRRLLEALAGADPATPVWTWADGHHDVAFVFRRMAQETAVHRVDAERAAGRDHEVEPALAADGIDELLRLMLPWLAQDKPPLTGRVHLHCTDTEGEWTVAPAGEGGLAITTGHAKGDAALRGRAHDLLMAVWHRDGTERLEIFGDAALANAFLALIDSG